MVDHQPLARLEPDGTYRPACLCGWTHTRTYANRTEAMIMVRLFHDDGTKGGTH